MDHMIQKRITSDIVDSPLAAASAEVSALQDAADEIEQLRIAYQQAMNTLEQAVDEIERLQAELAAWQGTVRAHEYLAAKAADEIEQLREAGNAMADDVPHGYESLRQWLEARRD